MNFGLALRVFVSSLVNSKTIFMIIQNISPSMVTCRNSETCYRIQL